MTNQINIDSQKDLEHFKNKLLKVLRSETAKQYIDFGHVDCFIDMIDKPLNQYKTVEDTIKIFKLKRKELN